MENLFKSSFFKNFSILTGANILMQALSVLSSIRMARQLHPDGYGLFNLVIMQSAIFSIIAAYGLRTVIIRHIARNRNDVRKIYYLSNRIRIISTLIASFIAGIYNLFQTNHTLSGDLMIVLIALVVFLTFWDTIESISFGFEKMEATALINLLFGLIWVCEVYLIPNSYFRVSILLYVYVFNQIVKTIIFYIWLKKTILKIPESPVLFSGNEYGFLIKQSSYYFILAIFTAIQNQIPVLFLQFNSSIDQIGIFNLGYRILSPLQMVLSMLLTALFPMFSRLALIDKDVFVNRIKTLLNIILFVGISGCISFALFSHDVVHLLYGEKYTVSASVILIQCWYTVLFSIFCLCGTVLSSFDKQKLLAIFSIISGIISLPIFYFGSKFGALGLAWSFVISAFVNMTYLWVYFKTLLLNKIWYLYTFTVFATLGLLCWATSKYPVNLSFNIRLSLLFVLSITIVGYIYKIVKINILRG